MRKKGFSLCLAAITCVSLLAGCGEKAKESQTVDNTSAVQTQEQEAADEQNGEVIQLKFTSWSAGGEQKAVKQALASFEEQNPGIKVEAEFIDNANYTAKINTLMAAGDAPNVAQLNGYLAPEYGAKGQLLDLKPYLEGQVDFEDILPEAIFEYDDKIWGMTFGVECQMVLYNKALFEEAGIDAPSTDAANPWTWEEYVDAAVKLTKDINGKHPGEEGFDSNNISVWGTKVFDSPIFNFTLLNSNGGAYIAAEGDRVLVDSEESKEVLKELQDLIYVHQVAPKPAVTSAMPSSQQMLMDGQLGMYMAGQFEIATFAEAEWGDFGVAPLPKFKKPASMIWGEPLVVYDSKDEKVNEAAVKLVLALSNPAEVNDLFVTAAQMPIYKSWYTDPEKKAVWTDNAWHNESLMSYFDSLFQTETTSREAYYVKNYDPIMAIVQPRLDKIWDGVDVDTALEGLQDEVAPEMQGYYKIVDYYSDAK